MCVSYFKPQNIRFIAPFTEISGGEENRTPVRKLVGAGFSHYSRSTVHSLGQTPTDRRISSVASLVLSAGQSLTAKVPRQVDAGYLGVGRPRTDSCLKIRLQVINYCRLFFKVLNLLGGCSTPMAARAFKTPVETIAPPYIYIFIITHL